MNIKHYVYEYIHFEDGHPLLLLHIDENIQQYYYR